MRPSRVRSAGPTRGVTLKPRARAPPRYFGYSARVAWLATWCAITSSQEGLPVAITALLGAEHRPENGRSKADPAARPRFVGPRTIGPRSNYERSRLTTVAALQFCPDRRLQGRSAWPGSRDDE